MTQPEQKIKTTPMMAQYLATKEKYADYLLFYRMGDFYELFFEDAKKASQALDIVLTFRGKYAGEDVPMCGVPFHAYESYLVRLVKAGYKVAICEQLETPEEAKKRGTGATIKRDVIRIITPGTLTEDALLSAKRSNFLACVFPAPTGYALAWTDISTGEVWVQSVEKAQLQNTLARIEASEILTCADQEWQADGKSILNDTCFKPENVQQMLCDFYGDNPCDNLTHAQKSALGALLSYVKETQKGQMPVLKAPLFWGENQFMQIDGSTRKSLELLRPISAEKGSLSLLDVIDKTLTAAGGRALSAFLAAPLLDVGKIEERLNRISYFVENESVLSALRDVLKDMPDLERALSRLSLGRGGPRDMQAISVVLSKVPQIRSLLYSDFLPDELKQDCINLGEYSALSAKLSDALKEDLPLLARDGGFIKKGFDDTLDSIREIQLNAKKVIADMQARYAQMTQVANLKISFNNILGYFIEVPSSKADFLWNSTEFIHRQTMANVMRFTTKELAELQSKILHADEQALGLELKIFEQLKTELVSLSADLLKTAHVLALLDVFSGLAFLAIRENLTRPTITSGKEFEIIGGRHLVVEASLKKSQIAFVPNHCELSLNKNLWILTGPNMAGKSTFLRQNALIAVMAQMGSFVPAEKAVIGIVDKLFSRVGASDNLAKGQSTFMVEMVEVAAILNGATDRSLVILDEVGRGTATFDGLSLAWAIVEYLHNHNQCRALFATHYHELTQLADKLPQVSLHTMKIQEWKNEVVFLHEVIAGAANRSYGIHVARLAGVPEPVLNRANVILDELEAKAVAQKSIFDDLPLFNVAEKKSTVSAVEQKLRDADLDLLTPKEALDFLYELKRSAN